MREKYIEQVKRNLVVSRKQKNEVIRDLQEAFASAVENGETDQQVIERFGSPSDFADNVNAQLGLNRVDKLHSKKRTQIGVALAVAVAAFVVGFYIKTSRIPDNVIGQADAMTNIQISGAAIDPFVLFMAGGAVALVVAIALLVRYFKKSEKK